MTRGITTGPASAERLTIANTEPWDITRKYTLRKKYRAKKAQKMSGDQKQKRAENPPFFVNQVCCNGRR
jgi:hypothetical protein